MSLVISNIVTSFFPKIALSFSSARMFHLSRKNQLFRRNSVAQLNSQNWAIDNIKSKCQPSSAPLFTRRAIWLTLFPIRRSSAQTNKRSFSPKRSFNFRLVKWASFRICGMLSPAVRFSRDAIKLIIGEADGGTFMVARWLTGIRSIWGGWNGRQGGTSDKLEGHIRLP